MHKRGGNLLTADLDDILTDRLVGAKDFVHTLFIKTVVAVVHSKNEKELVDKY